MDFVDEVQSGFVAGDGPFDGALSRPGPAAGSSIEELCLTNPDVVRDFHHRYIAAGARLIRTNTQGANAVRLAKSGAESRVNELNWSAAQLARECAKGKGVYAAGAIGPSGVTAEQASQRGIDRSAIFQEQMGALLDGGVQVIMLEKFVDLDELLLALHVKHSLHHCPAICVFSAALQVPSTDPPAPARQSSVSPPLTPERSDKSSGRAPRFSSLAEIFSQVLAHGADFVGLGCAADSLTIGHRLGEVKATISPLCAFPDGPLTRDNTSRFASTALALVDQGVRLVGGCCGVTPADIEAMVIAVGARQSAK